MQNQVQKEHWTLASKCTSKTRWRLLQWKILHNIYPTSILLNKMGISNNKNYAFGCNQTDYLDFFFFTCKKISTIWNTWRKTFIISLRLN